MIFSPIHHTFAPHATASYAWKAKMLSLMPWNYRRNGPVTKLEEELGAHLQADVVTFGSGREGLFALMKALRLQPDEEVIVQGYTCVVVPNAVNAAGMKTVYADIDRETLNLNIEETEKAITPKTRAIICQHTFGIPANAKKLRELCDKNGLALIEDCAHIIPDRSGPSEIGRHGDFILLSFGRDKAISGISGGAMVSRRKDVTEELRRLQSKARPLSRGTVWALLQYPLLYLIARPLYGLGIGKALLVMSAKLKMLVPIVTRREKLGDMPAVLHRMPAPCAQLALGELHALQTINDHRRMLTKLYLEHGKMNGWPVLEGVTADLPLQKFPLFIAGADRIRATLKKQNVHLSDGWTGCVICPAGVDEAAAGYEDGTDPAAEAVCEQILSLPTHPTMTLSQAHTLIQLLDPLLKR
ncbi:MAG TPA: aminotransferase class I/II-fold pyridoxal phosphate-dependent enzyme [Candidatus Peribacteraceae bacterium]|nr:aminotransferase class I/II-fold pyridoxal phosphate-dependent enzyme [Candidatus Peribacteraceae bacterium]